MNNSQGSIMRRELGGRTCMEKRRCKRSRREIELLANCVIIRYMLKTVVYGINVKAEICLPVKG